MSKYKYFSHLMQPLNGIVASKLERLPSLGKDLKQYTTYIESKFMEIDVDGSSFPTGGVIPTHNSRARSIITTTNKSYLLYNTIYIPSFLYSQDYTSIDYYSVLIRSESALIKQLDILSEKFNFRLAEKNDVYPTLGWEQEFFLVDKKEYDKRLDLKLTGRDLINDTATLIGTLHNNYFNVSNTINIAEFIDTVYDTCNTTGIAVNGFHSEVAPNQYEISSEFSMTSDAISDNLMFMEVLKNEATNYGMQCLLHEKPFSTLNGSGKHCNWSVYEDNVGNLLDIRTHKPSTYMYYIILVLKTLEGIHDYRDILETSITTAGNMFRLGGAEAPPSSITSSVNMHLMDIIEDLLKCSSYEEFLRHATVLYNKREEIYEFIINRNRTSPLPFVGNRFEFRGVGASVNPSEPVMLLNTILAKKLEEFMDSLINEDTNEPLLCFECITNHLKKSYRKVMASLYTGDCYSEDYKTFCNNLGAASSVEDIYNRYTSENVVALFEATEVMCKEELEIRSKAFNSIHSATSTLYGTVGEAIQTQFNELHTPPSKKAGSVKKTDTSALFDLQGY